MKKPPSRILERKIKMLSSELKMLQSYKLDAALLYDDYKVEFFSDMALIESRLSPASSTAPPEEEAEVARSDEDPHTLRLDPTAKEQRWRKTKDGWEREDNSSDTPEEISDVSSKPEVPPWAKKLYKKIALLSHPDRTIESENKKRLNRIFTESAAALSAGEFNKLVGYALDLGVEFSDADVDHVPILKQRIGEVKKELSDIEKSIEWLWCESLGMIEMRVVIAQSFLKEKCNHLNIEEIKAIIQKMEDDAARENSKS